LAGLPRDKRLVGKYESARDGEEANDRGCPTKQKQAAG